VTVNKIYAEYFNTLLGKEKKAKKTEERKKRRECKIYTAQ
jgi:hypothetical protein